MAIEAPLSKYSRTNYKLGIVLLVGLAAIFAYDGYLSRYEWSHRRGFYEKHSRTLLFRVAAERQNDLEGGVLSQRLRRDFETAKSRLSDSATVSVDQPGEVWAITDQAKTYSIRKEPSALAAYREGPDDTLWFNRVSPIFFLLGAAAIAGRWWSRRGVKLVAEENELIVAGKLRIPYDAIERIDKTHFESKGFFTVTYKSNGREVERRLGDRTYDNLRPILDHLIAKIT